MRLVNRRGCGPFNRARRIKMKRYFTCPKCKYMWSYGYFEWTFKALFHWFNFREMKDYRWTKCPRCGETSLICHN